MLGIVIVACSGRDFTSRRASFTALSIFGKRSPMGSHIPGQGSALMYLKARPIPVHHGGVVPSSHINLIIFKMVHLKSYLLALATCAVAAPSASGPCHHTRSPETIEWAPCGDLGLNETVELSCGSLTVPQDYAEPESGETIDLQIFKIPAPNQPSKGSVFMNFGGPGASGIADMAAAGNLLTM